MEDSYQKILPDTAGQRTRMDPAAIQHQLGEFAAILLSQGIEELPEGARQLLCDNEYDVQRAVDHWVVTMKMPHSSVYAAEEHRLQVRFDDTYPLSAPEVVFLQPTPVHPHVYSNGHICLSTLDCDWSPAMSVESLCVSIHSMLCSCKEQEKKRPDGDLQYVRSVGGRSPKLTRWAFHDDKC